MLTDIVTTMASGFVVCVTQYPVKTSCPCPARSKVQLHFLSAHALARIFSLRTLQLSCTAYIEAEISSCRLHIDQYQRSAKHTDQSQKSAMEILMLQPYRDNRSSNAVIFASILPEELKAYLQYTTNPIDEVIEAFMHISSKMIFNFSYFWIIHVNAENGRSVRNCRRGYFWSR